MNQLLSQPAGPLPNLFGEPVVQPRKKAVLTQHTEPEPVAPVEPTWLAQAGGIAYLNSGLGYDLSAGRRLCAPGCFGYVLQVNTESREALVHVPKPLNRTGKDEFFIMPLRDLRDCASVISFDRTQFIEQHPPVGCLITPVWEVNPRR